MIKKRFNQVSSLLILIFIIILIGIVFVAAASIDFTLPTPPDDASTTNTSIEINVSITEANLDEVKFNWNGANYTMYNDSLVLMMNFDNVSALGENDTHVVDVSTYGNNGTVIGGNYTTADGKYQRAMMFDGSNDYVNISHSSSLVLDNYTISVWIHADATQSSWANIIGKTVLLENEYILQFDGEGDDMIVAHQWGEGWDTLIDLNEIDDTWHHIVITYEGTTLISYLDGNIKRNATHATAVTQSNNPLYIGRDGAGDYFFKGKIDEVRIWNTGLSADEVYEHYVSNLNKYDTDKWLLYVNQSKNSTDVLDEGVYTYQGFAKDDSGNLNQTEERIVTVDTTTPTINFTSPTTSSGTYSQNYIIVNVTASDTHLANITIYLYNSTALEESNTSSTSPFFWNITNLADGTYYLNVTVNDTAGNVNQTETRTISLDTVYPLINFTSPTPANDTTTTNTSIEINVSIVEADLGEVKFNWNGTNYTMYNDSLVFMMNFDNVSALDENDTYVVDVSSGGNGGTVIGGNVTTADGKYGRAMMFDGNDDIVNVSHSSSLVLDDYTISVWIYADATQDDWSGIVGKCSGAGNEYILQFSSPSTDIIMLHQTSPEDFWDTNIDLNEVDDTWHHIVITRDGTTQTSYLDGTIKRNATYAIEVTQGTSPLYIGTERALGFFFDGLLDEVRIWNKSLSATEIQQQYMSNLNKYDIDKWLFYVNQSKNSTDVLDEGVYTYQAFASDNAGNLNQTEERIVTVDTTTPTINVFSPTNTSYSTSTIYFNASADEAVDTWIVNYNGTNITHTINTSLEVEDGSYHLFLYANDSAGNFGLNDSIYFTVDDTTAPTIQVQSPTNTTYSTSTIYFNATADETIDTWIVNYNGTNITLSDINTTLTVEDGNHHLFLYANDSNGNVGLNDSIYFTVDTTAPIIQVQSPTNTSYSTSTIYFNATADETIDTWIVNYNGTNVTHTINTSLTVEEGIHHLLLYGNDSIGNWGLNGNIYFTVDVTAPTATLTCSPSTIIAGGVITCTCGVTDTGGSGVNTSATSYTTSPSTFNAGTFILTCTFEDLAGNSGSETTSYTVESSEEIAETTTEEPPPTETQTWTEVTPEAPAVMEITEPGLDLTTITITTIETVESVSLTVTTVDVVDVEADMQISLPPEVSTEVYQAFEIETTGITGGDIEEVVIDFKVEKSWVEEQEGTENEIFLYRKDETTDEWNSLETNFIDSDDEYYYFSATSPGFSIFVVVIDLSVCNNNGICETEIGEDESNCPNDCKVVVVEKKGFFETIKSYLWTGIVFVLIIAIGLVVLIIRSKKGKQSKRHFKKRKQSKRLKKRVKKKRTK